ncbi:MAG: helix-turn-helix transcriptional regulator [Desulfobacterales bacterium]|nr:helix-turn-helix transcriptional regulator [Desulfobacterales bacterium]
MKSIQYPYLARLPKYIGRAIRDIRKQKQMTQKDLADVTGTSVKFISNVERGKETVQIDKVFVLLKALEIMIYLSSEPLNEKNNEH